MLTENKPAILPHVRHPLLGEIISCSEKQFQSEARWQCSELHFLLDYKIMGKIFVAGATFIEMVFSALRLLSDNEELCVENMRIEKTLLYNRSSDVTVCTNIFPDGICKISTKNASSTETIHATFQVAGQKENTKESPEIIPFNKDLEVLKIDSRLFFEKLRLLGVEYGPSFRLLHSIELSKTVAQGRLYSPESVDSFFLHPTSIYSGFQLLTMMLAQLSLAHNQVFLPVGIGRIESLDVSRRQDILTSQVVMQYKDQMPVGADIYWFDTADQCVFVVRDFKIDVMDPEKLSRLLVTYSEQSADADHAENNMSIIQTMQAMLDRGTRPGQIDNELDRFAGICWIVIVWATRIVGLFE